MNFLRELLIFNLLDLIIYATLFTLALNILTALFINIFVKFRSCNVIKIVFSNIVPWHYLNLKLCSFRAAFLTIILNSASIYKLYVQYLTEKNYKKLIKFYLGCVFIFIIRLGLDRGYRYWKRTNPSNWKSKIPHMEHRKINRFVKYT